MRHIVAVVILGLFAYWLPTDSAQIRLGFQTQPDLALGIGLKIVMHLLAALGLFLDKTFGYAFLLGACIQGLLIDHGYLQVLPSSQWLAHWEQFKIPLFDAALRIFSLLFLAFKAGRIVGIGGSK